MLNRKSKHVPGAAPEAHVCVDGAEVANRVVQLRADVSNQSAALKMQNQSRACTKGRVYMSTCLIVHGEREMHAMDSGGPGNPPVQVEQGPPVHPRKVGAFAVVGPPASLIRLGESCGVEGNFDGSWRARHSQPQLGHGRLLALGPQFSWPAELTGNLSSIYIRTHI